MVSTNNGYAIWSDKPSQKPKAIAWFITSTPFPGQAKPFPSFRAGLLI